jgi:hypothetical protein
MYVKKITYSIFYFKFFPLLLKKLILNKMKKIITITTIMMLLSMVGFSQNAPIDFESAGNGASWTWTTFENGTNPTLTVENNPSKTGANTSDKVGKFTALVAGQPWAGCESAHGSDIGKYTLSSSTSTIKIMVYKSVKSDVGIKLVEAGSGSLGEIKVANTKINEWEELTFNFASREGIEYDQIVFFMDFQARSSENVCYFDNVTFGPAPMEAVPTVSASDPTFASADVISMFCGVYTDVTVDTWRTGWSNATLTDIQVAGNDVKKYSDMDVVGVETVGGNVIDASAMTHLNLDVWSPNSTQLKVKLVDFGADGAFQGGDDTEHELIFNAPAMEEWVNYNIPLADFTNLTGKEHIAQMILVSGPAGSNTIYVDNIFYSVGSGLAEPMTAATDPNYAADDVISLFSGVYTDVTVDTWRTGWSNATLTDMQVAGNDVKKYSAMDVVGIETVGANLVDVSGMDDLNLDVWSPNSTQFKIKIVDFGADAAFQGGDDSEHELVFDAPVMGEWVNYHIPLSDFTGLTGKTSIAQIIFVSQPTGSSVVYLDNLFFSKGFPTSVTEKEAFSSFNVFPNPASDVLTINLIANTGNIVNYSLKSITGQTILTNEVNSKVLNETINIANFETGVYFLELNTDQGGYTHKIIIK